MIVIGEFGTLGRPPDVFVAVGESAIAGFDEFWETFNGLGVIGE